MQSQAIESEVRAALESEPLRLPVIFEGNPPRLIGRLPFGSPASATAARPYVDQFLRQARCTSARISIASVRHPTDTSRWQLFVLCHA